MKRTFPIAVLMSAVLSIPASAPAQEQEPIREIVNLRGDLYRAQNNNHFNVFLVTSDGIILTDPINRDFSLWLKAELQRQFEVPVRYVLYTHHHWDHASGGVVFADTAEFVGHETMRTALALPGGSPPLPENVRSMDTNGNGVIERGEATGVIAERFDLYDENRDGVLTGAEIVRGPVNDVYPPTVTFSDRHTVTLGGKTVTMVHIGPAHSADSTVIHFADERTVFGADTLQTRRLPGGLAPTVGAWIDAMRTVLELDFDIAATGHALVGTRADMEALLQYLDDVATGVAGGVAAGKSLEEIQESLALDAYREWDRHDTLREAHIAQVFATLQGTAHAADR